MLKKAVNDFIDNSIPKSNFTSTNLKVLKDLTEKLHGTPTLAELVDHYKDKKVVYEEGKFWGECLSFIEGEVAIQRTWVKKGYRVPEHRHPGIEIGLVEEGAFEMVVEGRKLVFKSGDVFYFKSNEKHKGTMLEDSIFILISVPPAKGYPK